MHDALRNVGKFPLVITTNMDDLLERFLWKGGNVGEKVRLDQVSETFHLLLAVLAVQIAKIQLKIFHPYTILYKYVSII